MIRADTRLVLSAQTMNAREMVDKATRHARAVWAGTVLSAAVFCGIAWRIDVQVATSPFPVWDNVSLIYTIGALCAAGALLVRQRIYGRADELREKLLRTSLAAGPEPPTHGAALLAEALVELSQGERSVWTLAFGPALLPIPCVLLSGDSAPMVPLALASFAALALTFPRTAGFARRAGVLTAGPFPTS